MDNIFHRRFQFKMKKKGTAQWYLHHWRKKYFADQHGGMVLLPNGLYMQEGRFHNYKIDENDNWNMDYLNESLFQLVSGIYLQWKKLT